MFVFYLTTSSKGVIVITEQLVIHTWGKKKYGSLNPEEPSTIQERNFHVKIFDMYEEIQRALFNTILKQSTVWYESDLKE